MRQYYIFIGGLCVVSVILIILQFTVSKGPAADQNKVDDLTSINTSVQTYATTHDALPTNLNDLSFSPKLNNNASSYEYTPSLDSYKVCATFSTDQSGNNISDDNTDPTTHKSGHQCFDRTVTVSRFNSNEKFQNGSSSSGSNLDSNSLDGSAATN